MEVEELSIEIEDWIQKISNVLDSSKKHEIDNKYAEINHFLCGFVDDLATFLDRFAKVYL